ncbi:hypothetical protein H2198_009230 [Neophaeococcomyces mojaviensis]|uniref:Uncharacterized protein n=1 Tax=Neophaeococcomyces mojaviensis TaxID=3383035 RepID=A0ACC2ZV98_9EURO|nr:hypothetical protein H2198_009230 [Knufia sp. JES_112]
MDRIKRFFEPAPAYAPINTTTDEHDHDDESSQTLEENNEPPFSWVEYSIFLLLGVAMLWAWNMFLAAAPYFQSRFKGSKWILNHFQAAEISVSCVTNLVSMIILSKLQKNASYPKRIASSLTINAVAFTILALSTLVKTSAGVYFGFLLVTIFVASLSTGLIQNGLFAFASGFGKGEYTQAIMTGQAVAGVLPPLTQIISVLVISSPGESAGAAAESHTSAFIYFITATVVSVIALLAFFYLLRRQAHAAALQSAKDAQVHGTSEGDILASSHHSDSTPERTTVGLWTLFRKLPFLSSGVFICFAVTMIGFPVFTASIRSVSNIDSAIFIPLAFLVWNIGDLAGRLVTISPKLSLTHYPFALFCIAMARLLFIPLYFLCNVKGRGAVVASDFFYLVIVQFLYGLTNGYVGSECMMGAGEWVAPEEREAAGGFMGLMLVGGLTAGSLLSFALGDV